MKVRPRIPWGTTGFMIAQAYHRLDPKRFFVLFELSWFTRGPRAGGRAESRGMGFGAGSRRPGAEVWGWALSTLVISESGLKILPPMSSVPRSSARPPNPGPRPSPRAPGPALLGGPRAPGPGFGPGPRAVPLGLGPLVPGARARAHRRGPGPSGPRPRAPNPAPGPGAYGHEAQWVSGSGPPRAPRSRLKAPGPCPGPSGPRIRGPGGSQESGARWVSWAPGLRSLGPPSAPGPGSGPGPRPIAYEFVCRG